MDGTPTKLDFTIFPSFLPSVSLCGPMDVRAPDGCVSYFEMIGDRLAVGVRGAGSSPRGLWVAGDRGLLWEPATDTSLGSLPPSFHSVPTKFVGRAADVGVFGRLNRGHAVGGGAEGPGGRWGGLSGWPGLHFPRICLVNI